MRSDEKMIVDELYNAIVDSGEFFKIDGMFPTMDEVYSWLNVGFPADATLMQLTKWLHLASIRALHSFVENEYDTPDNDIDWQQRHRIAKWHKDYADAIATFPTFH